jgi:putative ABC transport system permease protein
VYTALIATSRPVRDSIGADKRQIVRQLVVEVVVLVAIGAAAGVAVALGLLQAATALLPDAETFFRARDSLFSATPGLTRVGAGMVGLDLTTFAFAAGLSFACAALIAILPARQALVALPIEALRAGGAKSAARARLRDPLVVAQIALALVLLGGAGLMLKSVWRLQATGAGIDADNIVAVLVHVPADEAAPQAELAFLTQLLERVRTLPGIESAALGSCVPASGGCASSTITADEPFEPGRGSWAGVYMVSDGYAETLGIRLLAGRVFSGRDYGLEPRAVLVNEAAAQALWPGRDPMGAKVASFGFRDGVEVVGVVSNVRYQAIETPPQPDIYLPLGPLSFQSSRLPVFVRSELTPAAIVAMIRSELRALDPNVTLTGATTMEERLDNAIWRTRLTAWLLGAVALAAGYLPARRAARVDAMATLRTE